MADSREAIYARSAGVRHAQPKRSAGATSLYSASADLVFVWRSWHHCRHSRRARRSLSLSSAHGGLYTHKHTQPLPQPTFIINYLPTAVDQFFQGISSPPMSHVRLEQRFSSFLPSNDFRAFVSRIVFDRWSRPRARLPNNASDPQTVRATTQTCEAQ